MSPDKNQILVLLRQASSELYNKYGVTRIGIFGSVARNQASDGSDVDIVYEIMKPNLFTTVHLKAELEKLLHFPVDLVRYREKMPPLLKKRIENEGVYV